MKIDRTNFYYFLAFCFPLSMFSQENSFSLNWTHLPSTPQEFIENNGQFDEFTDGEGKIRFAAYLGWALVTFSSKGLQYHSDYPLIKETGAILKHTKPEKKETEKMKTHTVKQTWLGSSPFVILRGENAVSNYYTYQNPQNLTTISGLKATAFKKIIFKNIYPNIDIEYFFVPGKDGIKYNLILHPGSNSEDLKMRYSQEAKAHLDSDGNIRFQFHSHELIEHAPLSFEEENSFVPSSYQVENNNTFSFRLGPFDTSKTLTVDPWINNPGFTTINKPFVVHADMHGNSYTLGGSDSNASYLNPTQLKKFDSNGILIWTFFIPNPSNTVNGMHRTDFTLNRTTGEVYIISNLMLPNTLLKVDTQGIVIASYQHPIHSLEFWRTTYNHCADQIILGLGNLVSSSLHNTIVLDGNLSNATSYTYPVPKGDISSLYLDREGKDLFFLSLANHPSYATLHRLSTANFDSLSYAISSNFVDSEVQFAYKTIHNHSIVSDKNFVYMSNGYKLEKRNKLTGSLLSSATLAIPPNSQRTSTWGGLDIDECNNLYVAVKSQVLKFDSDLNQISSFQLPDTIYYLQLSDGDRLHICGRGFLVELQLTVTPFVLTQIHPSICNDSSGIVSIAPRCPFENQNNFSFLWNTVPPQHGDTAFHLPPGMYSVMATSTDCFQSVVFSDSIELTSSMDSLFSASITSTPTSCYDHSGTAQVKVIGSDGPFLYQWNTSPPQFGEMATGLSEGSWMVTIYTTNGCYITQTVEIVHNEFPTALFQLDTVNGCAPLTIRIKDNSSPSEALVFWDFGDGTTSLSNPITTHTYEEPGSYELTQLVSIGHCQDSYTYPQLISPSPIAIAAFKSNMLATTQHNSAFEFYNLSTFATEYQWDFGDGTYSTNFNGHHSYLSATGAFEIQLIANNKYDCPDTCSALIVVNESTDFYIPNSFTPDQNQLNPIFLPVFPGDPPPSNYHFKIFNRWGELIFESKDPAIGWNGLYEGNIAPTTTYCWYLEFKKKNADTLTRISGHVNLLK
jgi:gliding motility-associated-like protein